MEIFVEFFVFLQILLPMLHIGLLVQLCYFASYYYIHGGNSGNGFICGSLSVAASTTAGNTGWARGAALSFIPCTHYILRGDNSNHGSYCGIFSVNVSGAVSGAAWHLGAALNLYTLS